MSNEEIKQFSTSDPKINTTGDVSPTSDVVETYSTDYVSAFSSTGLLTDATRIKDFITNAGKLWHHILAYQSTTLTGYYDVFPNSGVKWISPGSGVSYNSMMQITTIRNLFAENAAYGVDSDTVNQPSHFDNASILTAGIRSTENGFGTALQGSVSNIISKYDTFIKNQTGYTTTKSYIDTLFNKSDWITLFGATQFGTDFINFWRYAAKSEMRIPLYTYTLGNDGTTWTSGTVNPSLVPLSYGTAMEARLTSSGYGSATVTLSGYSLSDNGTTWLAGSTLTGATLSTQYTASDTPVATSYVALGTKTSVKNARLGVSGVAPYGLFGGVSGMEITIYSK